MAVNLGFGLTLWNLELIVSAGGSAPVNSVLPAITGTLAVGQTVTVSNGTWSNTPTSYAYQWYDGAIAISGATASTYVIQSGDAGLVLGANVTASNGAGSATATATGGGTVTSGATTPALKFNVTSNSQYVPILAF